MTYDEVVKDVSKDLSLYDESWTPVRIRDCMSRFLSAPLKDWAGGSLTPEEVAVCYAVYRIVKLSGACDIYKNLFDKRLRMVGGDAA